MTKKRSRRGAGERLLIAIERAKRRMELSFGERIERDNKRATGNPWIHPVEYKSDFVRSRYRALTFREMG